MLTRSLSGLVAAVLVSGLLSTFSHAVAASLGVSSAPLFSTTRQLSAVRTCNAAASADAYARSDLSAVNFGSVPTMEINSNSLARSRAFIRFDLEACSIPADALVTSAALRLTASSVASADVSYEARRINDAWTETGVSWANQPGTAAVPSATLTIASGAAAGTAYEWNVITDVQELVAGRAANRGWRISDALEGSVLNRLVVLHAREALVIGVPLLSVTYVN